ncbi:uncharacterized protein DDB_G0284459-like isoform X2 [Aedes albopictus]|uniref:Uncharacterized protein n=1 Tax=Aedes albopictus TaxID=7160 RepID=A0ABM1ZHC6_AEDAL
MMRLYRSISSSSPGSNKSPEKNQLNNQRPSSGLKKVRNVGVNVNFISKSVAKHSNNLALATGSVASGTSPIIKKPTTPQSSGKIYRFYCSKLSPSQLWEQQHPELSYESSERSIFPRRIKKNDLMAKQKEQQKVDQPKELKVVHLTEGLVHCAINEDKEVTKTNEEPEKVQDEKSSPATPAITKHVIPVISIKGDWKACLQVQETCRINILDEKRCENAQNRPSNLMYVEIKHGGMNPVSETRSPVDDQNIEARPADAAKTVRKESSEVVIDQKCVDKSSNSPKTNRYLQPFIDVRKARTPSNQQLFVDLSDSNSDDSAEELILEADSSDSDSADNLQNILNLKSTAKATKKTKIIGNISSVSYKNESPIVPNEATSKVSVQLQVPSPPCRLLSPPKTPAKSPPADDSIEPCPDASSSSKFLENLRIWKSAIQVQSENMKLGNQLTENLDTLKQNMEVIAGETRNITQITRNCEQNLKQIEGLKDRYARNLDGSTIGSFRQENQFTGVTNHEATTTCSCFGCRPQLDTADPEPSFDQKAFQRAVLEQNPRYSKTIQKICEDGRNRSFRKSLTPPRDVAERAAQKFLESYSRSVSRISHRGGVPLDESSIRSHSPGSVRSWSESCRSRISSGTDGDVSLSSSWMVGGIVRHRGEYSDSVSDGREPVADRRDTGAFSSTSISDDKSSGEFRRMRKSLSDEGEVLSQGEIR